MENNDDLKENELEDESQDDLFYKDSILPNEPTVISSPSAQGTAPYYIKITGFSLGLKPKKNSRTCIVVKEDEDDEEPGVVGVLKEGQNENIQVDILITGSQLFSVEGTNPSKVHVVGHYIPSDQFIPDEEAIGFGDDDEMEMNEELDEDQLEQLMKMRGAFKRKRGEGEENQEDQEEEEEEEDDNDNTRNTQIDEVQEDEDEVQEPPAKKQKTNNGKSQTTQKKPNNKNKNKNKNKKNKKNNNNNEDNDDSNNNNNNKNQNKKKNKKNKKNKKSPQQSPQQTPKSPQNKKKKQFVNIGQGLRYKQLREGNGKQARKGSNVKVYYVGQLEDKTIFDKCLSGEGFKFKLGNQDVIKGWEKGVEGMKVGEKRRLVIPPHLAYGKEGSSPEIPPNSTLTFTIEVKSIN